MKKFRVSIIITGILLSVLDSVSIQINRKDSLQFVLGQNLADTERVKTLSELAIELTGKNNDSAFFVTEEAQKISEKRKWQAGIALCYHRRGYIYGEQSEFDKEIEWYQKAITIWRKEIKNDPSHFVKEGLASTLGNLALTYHKTGKINDAEKNYLESIELFTQLNLTRNIIGQTSNLGSLYTSRGEYKRALKIYQVGIDACIKTNNKRQEASLLGNIGVIYKEQRIFDKAIHYTQQAIILAKEADAKSAIAINTGNIGTIFYMMRQFNKALEYFEESLKLKKEIGNLTGASGTLSNMANVYMALGDSVKKTEGLNIAINKYYIKAEEVYQEALLIKLKTGDREGEGIVKGNYGSLFVKMKKYHEAEKLLIESSEIAKEVNDVIGIIETSERLGELFEASNNYEKAIHYYMLFKSIKDSVFNADKRSELTRQELNYEFEKKALALQFEHDKKEAANKEESKRKIIVITFLSAFFLLMLGVSVYIYKNLKKAKRQKSIIEYQKQLVEEKQQEIIDSILYARRIQKALITSENNFQKQIHKLRN